MLTPLLSPERLAAASQYRRVLADPESDSYADLRFRTGRYGRERLASLAAIEGQPGAAEIRANAEREMQKQFPSHDAQPEDRLAAEDLDIYPPTMRLDTDLMAAFNAMPDLHVLASCTSEVPCPLLFVDLNRDGSVEAILFAEQGVVGATRMANGWRVLDRYVHVGAFVSYNDRQAVTRALEQGSYRIGDLPWQAIEIDGEYYVLAEPRKAEENCGASGDAVSHPPAAAGGCP